MNNEFTPSKASQDIINTVFSELNKEMQNVFNISQNLVPVDTGLLKSTGNIESNKNDLNIKISYGGNKCNYALYVHEDLVRTYKNGQSKFLETPMNEFFSKLK